MEGRPNSRAILTGVVAFSSMGNGAGLGAQINYQKGIKTTSSGQAGILDIPDLAGCFLEEVMALCYGPLIVGYPAAFH